MAATSIGFLCHFCKKEGHIKIANSTRHGWLSTLRSNTNAREKVRQICVINADTKRTTDAIYKEIRN